MRDSQRSAVYKWGHTLHRLYPQPDIGLEGARALVEIVCRDYGKLAPVVTDGRGRRRACYAPLRCVIKLPRWARNPLTVLHEVAHHIVRDRPAHGPQFATLYAQLLERYLDIPAKETMALGREQRPRRVHYAL